MTFAFFETRDSQFYFGHGVHVKTFGCFMAVFRAETRGDTLLVCRSMLYLVVSDIASNLAPWLVARTGHLPTYLIVRLKRVVCWLCC